MWLYVPNECPPLPSYSPDLLRGDLPKSWEELPPLEDTKGCALVVGCDQGPKGLGPNGDEGDPYLHQLRVLSLKMRHHPQWEFRGPTDPTIKSRVTIHEDDLDQWVMKVMGEYMLDHGKGSPRRPLASAILH
jgi:hypothetical protein